jgi:fluoride exporter
MMMSVVTVLLVALAGSCGAVCRAAVAHTVAIRVSSSMPWGTWVVNLIGAFLFGVMIATASRLDWPPLLTTVVGAGFLGAFTTFSTWMYETIRLVEEHAWRTAMMNIVGPLLAGPLIVLAGSSLATWTIGLFL